MVDTYFDTILTTTNSDIKFDIYNILGRVAKNLYVINDGLYDMFIKIRRSMKLPNKAYTLSGYWIPHGKIRYFHNVYEIIVAKSNFRNRCRITESVDNTQMSIEIMKRYRTIRKHISEKSFQLICKYVMIIAILYIIITQIMRNIQ